ncbi:MAG: class I SAM-dependent methyltransferase [Chloroflexota bacterium]
MHNPMPNSFVNSEAERESGETVSFSFGANWSKFLEDLDTASLTEAAKSLGVSFNEMGTKGERFIDVGSGSGLFSLCALRSGASSVLSIDVDPNALDCARFLRTREDDAARWEIAAGSVLDEKFISGLEPGTRVFSWGVLHHTGAMWRAIRNMTPLVSDDGLLCLALYNRPNRPTLHLALKRAYNRLPRPLRPGMRVCYGTVLLAMMAIFQRRNPFGYVGDYARNARGMSFWRDVEDWLGGLPFEWADRNAVTQFVEALGFETLQVIERNPGACNEYLFRRLPPSGSPK